MSNRSSGYHRDASFPHEAFVQAAIEHFFVGAGFEPFEASPTDFACKHPSSGQLWYVESKGETKDIGLAFKTGIGQLIVRAKNRHANYAMAVPNIPAFLSQCNQVPSWVREATNLFWLLVSSDSSVRVVKPGESI